MTMMDQDGKVATFMIVCLSTPLTDRVRDSHPGTSRVIEKPCHVGTYEAE